MLSQKNKNIVQKQSIENSSENSARKYDGYK
jgi:hypothetical protein